MADFTTEVAAAQSPVSSRPVITTPAANPSVASVLALPELVHEILDHLPFQDLFTASRACGGFKDTINNTRTLREKLACESVQVTRFHRNRKGLSYSHDRIALPDLDASGHAIMDKWLLCPLLTRPQDQDHELLKLAPAGPRTADDETHPGDRVVPLAFSAEQYFADPATWRSVYLTSPPPSYAQLWLEFILKLPSGRWMALLAKGTMDSPEGDITVGRLVDVVLASCSVLVSMGGAGQAVKGPPFEHWKGEEFLERVRRAEVEMGVKARLKEATCSVLFARG